MQKKYLYLSLAFNVVVILTFIFFSFISPLIPSKKANTDRKFKESLSDTQKHYRDSLSNEFSQAEYHLRIRNIENRLRLWELLMEDSLHKLEIDSVMNNLEAGENRIKTLRYEMYLQEKYILTAEQRRERLWNTYLRLKTYLDKIKSSRQTEK